MCVLKSIILEEHPQNKIDIILRSGTSEKRRVVALAMGPIEALVPNFVRCGIGPIWLTVYPY